jgi:hypothetical protein
MKARKLIRNRRHLIATALVMGAALLPAIIVNDSVAGAAHTTRYATNTTCYGSGCNNLDPYATGCANGAYEVTSAGRYLRNPYGGTNGSVVHLFWSPRCQTNWAVVTQPQPCYDSEGTVVFANVENLSNGVWVDFSYQSKTAPTYVWGNMVYSPGPARAYGMVDCNGPYDYAGYSGTA